MGLRDMLRSGAPRTGMPFGSDPSQLLPESGDQALGHTGPQPDPGSVRPRIGTMPYGASGRANFYGLPAWDELNKDLIGPQGMMRFDEMYRTDGHARRLVLAAWSPIVAGTISLEPYGGEDASDQDRQIADQIWWLLTQWMSPNLYGHLYELGPVLLRSGFTPFEQQWDTVKYKGTGPTLLAPRKLALRLPRTIWRWWQDDYGDLTHIGQILPNRADVVIPASELCYYRLAPEGDNWMGTSLLRHAYKHWYLKDCLERLDAVGQERRAVGVPIAYHSPDVNPDVLDQFERALANMHMSEVAYLMVPGYKMGTAPEDAGAAVQFLIDVIKFDSSSGPGIEKSLEYHQLAMASSFLEDFLELGHHQVGARATADVQEDPFLTAVRGALLPPVLPVLDALVDRIRKLNWDSADGSPTLQVTLTDQASLSELAGYVQQLVQAGAIEPDEDLEDWLREYAGLPPANANARAARQQAEAQQPQPPAPAPAPEGNADGESPSSGKQPPASEGGPAGEGGPPTRPQGPPAKSGEPDGGGKQLDGEGAAGSSAPMPLSGGTASGSGLQMVDAVAGDDKRKRKRNAEDDEKADDDESDPARALDAAGPVAGGLIVYARDTGRVLVCQRSADNHDPADVFGSWEFPGGKLDPADRGAWTGALREWGEETGCTLPAGAQRLGDFASRNGAYRAFVVEIPHEGQIAGHFDKGEVAHLAWKPPGQLEHILSPRATLLLPHLQATLGKRLDVDQDNHAYREGVADRQAKRAKQTASQFAGRHTGADADDYPLSEAGYNADRDDLQLVPGRQLDDAEPTVKWWERLLSQDRLREAFDGCRASIETACGPEAQLAARKLAHQAANGTELTDAAPPAELTDALTSHYAGLYSLGRETVAAELAKQRKALGRTLDAAADTLAAAGPRAGRARQRGEQSARAIIGRVREQLARQQITGLHDTAAMTATAERAAAGQLHVEALTNAAAMVNDGRADGAAADSGVVGAYYTSVMDDRACFAPDTMIATRAGLRRAAEIGLGDELLTHAGRYVQPHAIIVSKIEGELLVIEAGGASVTATPDHPFLALSDAGLAWLPASQLSAGTLVVCDATLEGTSEAGGVDLVFREAPQLEAAREDVSGLAAVGVRPLGVPVGAIRLDDDVADHEVDDVGADLHLRLAAQVEAIELQAHLALDARLGVASAVTPERTETPAALDAGSHAKALPAVRTSDHDSGAATGLRAIGAAMTVESRPEGLAAPDAFPQFAGVLETAGPTAVGVPGGVRPRDCELDAAAGAALDDAGRRALALRRAVSLAPLLPVGEVGPTVLAREWRVASAGGNAALDAGQPLLSGQLPAMLGGAGLATDGSVRDASATVDTRAIHSRIVFARVDGITAKPYIGEVYDVTVPGDHTLWAGGLLAHNCDPCVTADDGQLLAPDDAVALGPPNPQCQGGDFCRCALVWVLSGDQAALQAVT